MTKNSRVRLAAAALLAIQMTALLPASAARPASASPATAQRAAQIRAKDSTSLITTIKRTKNKKRKEVRNIRLRHGQAMSLLQDFGIGWRSSGNCTDWRNPRCTSLDGIRPATLFGTIRLRQRSDCPVTVTGGTEVGHSSGPMSHRSGHKIDIAHNECLDAYIRRTFPYLGLRGDGARLYGSRSGNAVYAREPTHWDILFR